MNSKKAQIETRGSSKLAVLKGGPKFTKLIEASMYDTKPVNYTSMVSEELKWFVKEKDFFDVEMGKVTN